MNDLRFNNRLIRNPFKLVFTPEKYVSKKRALTGRLKVIKYITGNLDNVKVSFNKIDRPFLDYLKSIDNTYITVECTITGYEFSGNYFVDVPEVTSDNMGWYDDIEVNLTIYEPTI